MEASKVIEKKILAGDLDSIDLGELSPKKSARTAEEESIDEAKKRGNKIFEKIKSIYGSNESPAEKERKSQALLENSSEEYVGEEVDDQSAGNFSEDYRAAYEAHMSELHDEALKENSDFDSAKQGKDFDGAARNDQKNDSQSAENFSEDYKAAHDAHMSELHDEALKENSDYDRAKQEKDFAERSFEERDAMEMERLKKEVEEARKKFAKVDYDEDKKISFFRRILGKRIGGINTDTRRNAQSEYRAKLREFSSYEVDKLKKGDLADDEMKSKIEELVKYFDTDEKINLYEARTNARAEDWENKIGGKMMKKSGDFVNWYRKQSIWKKGALGVALAASGIFVTATGMGAIGGAVVGAANIGKRALGGAATGAGITAVLEARHRKAEKNMADGKRTEFMAQLEGEEAEVKFNFLMEKLDAETRGYGKDLKTEKRKAWERKAIGFGVGAFVGSGAMGDLLGKGLHAAGETDTYKTALSYWKEKITNFFASSDAEPLADTNADSFNSEGIIRSVYEDKSIPDVKISADTQVQATQPEEAYAAPEENVSIVEEQKIDLQVERGSSLEGTIIKHLRSAGMDAHEAGMKAHLMSVAYADENNLDKGAYSLIHPGAHIEISADGKIVNISGDDRLGYLQPKAVSEKIEIAEEKPVIENTPINHAAETVQVASDQTPTAVEAGGVDKTDIVTKNESVIGVQVSDTAMSDQEISANENSYENFYGNFDSSLKEFIKTREDIFSQYKGDINSEHDISNRINELNEKIANANAGGSGAILEMSPLTMFEAEQLRKLTAFKEDYLNMYGKMIRLLNGVGGGPGSDVLDSNAVQYLTDNKQGKTAMIFESMKKTVSPEDMIKYELDPKPGDKMHNWSTRVVRYILKNRMEK